MGRALEFEPDDAVLKAMMVFWERGYEATTIADLESGTGVGRKSLYRTFHDKHALFLRCLSAYRAYMGAQNLEPLTAPGAGLPEIVGLLRGMADFAGTEEAARGCMIANTALEVAPHDPAAACEVQSYFEQIRKAFAHALSAALEAGEIPPDTPVEREANFLVGIIQSISVMGRAGSDKQTISDVVEAALARLR